MSEGMTAFSNRYQKDISNRPKPTTTNPITAPLRKAIRKPAFNEFRAAKAVECVYRLFGARGLGSASFPKPEEPLFGDRVGYYLRTGKHDVTLADWQFVLQFIEKSTNCSN